MATGASKEAVWIRTPAGADAPLRQHITELQKYLERLTAQMDQLYGIRGQATLTNMRIQFQDGSATAPSIAFTSSQTTGIFRPAADTIAFTTAGVEGWEMNAVQRILIPTGKQLQVGANLLYGVVADKLNATQLAITSQVIGDLLYADTSTSYQRLAAVAVGQVLASGGVGAPPVWTDTPSLTRVNVSTHYRVSGTQVVSAQEAAVANASGGVVIDVQARTAINSLLDRLRTHGLIAT